MHNSVLYRQARRNNSILLRMERDFLCVCMPETSVSAKGNKFSGYFAAVPVVSKFAGPRWCLPPIRAIKFPLLQSLFTTPNTMSEPLSKNSTNAALRHWIQNPVPVDRQSLPKTTRPLSQKQPNVLLTSWIARLSVGLWKSFGNILSEKKSFLRSVSKRFEPFCTRKKSGSDALRHGKNAMTRSLSLKKTDSQVCKSTRKQRPHNFVRRVRPAGNSTPAGTGMVRNRPSAKAAGNVYSPSWCSALAGFLQCAQERAVGLYSTSQAASGISRSNEVVKEEISEISADSPDSGQLLATPQGKGVTVLSEEQYSFDMDADQCIMAQSYRMSVYPRQGICGSRSQLSRP